MKTLEGERGKETVKASKIEREGMRNKKYERKRERENEK
jgi:hypothetical protein